MAELFRRLRALVGRRHLDNGLDDELRFHIDQQTAKNLRAGMAPDEARRQARLRFGGVNDTREQTRDQLRFVRLEDTWREVRYSGRALRRAPSFTFAASMTIGLGIAASTTVFSVVYGVLLKPLPYPEADRLVKIAHVARGLSSTPMPTSASQWLTYRAENRTFEHIGLWSPGPAPVDGPAGPEEVQRVVLTHGTLEAFGVRPTLGRWLSAQDDTPGAADVALLGYDYWMRRYGSADTVIGRTVTIGGRAHEIVGVMPSGFRLERSTPDVIVPFRFDRSGMTLGPFNYTGVARLREGTTLTEANADVARLIPLWLSAWPTPPGIDAQMFQDARFTPALTTLRDAVVGDIGSLLWVVMGTVLIVLLVACANVANLLLIRAEGRQQELAVRSALGAGWTRIARSLLIESLLLGVVGGALGVAFTFAALRALIALEPARLPRLEEVGVDPIVLLFAVVASLIAGLLFGAMPIIRHARPSMTLALRGLGRTVSDSRERHRTRNALVVLQVGLALVLLTGAGLMIRTFQALRAVNPGFTSPEAIQTVRLAIPGTSVEGAEQVARTQQAIRDRIAGIPGVTAVSFISSAPLEDYASADILLSEGQAYPAGHLPAVRRFKFVAPSYFSTVGTPLLAGRDLTWTDVYERRRVAVVSENLARELWADPSAALGRRIRENRDSPWREVIGVVGDVRDDGMQAPAPATVYWPLLMDEFWGLPSTRSQRAVTFVIRSERAGTDSLVEDVRKAVWANLAGIPIGLTRTVADVYQQSLALTSFALVMLGVSAATAFVLGLIGIYGVVAYAVAQRRREIGIRLALGAPVTLLRGMFVRDGLRLAILGVGCGVLAAVAVTRVLSSLLFGVAALDPLTYVVCGTVLLLAAMGASYVPARRATKAPLADVLRAE